MHFLSLFWDKMCQFRLFRAMNAYEAVSFLATTLSFSDFEEAKNCFSMISKLEHLRGKLMKNKYFESLGGLVR